MTSHSSTLAWKIPWMEEPGRLQSMGSLRVGHDWVTSLSLSLFTFMHWRRKWQPTPVFLPGESHGWEAWWAAIYGVAQSRTRLKWLSSSSSRFYSVCCFSFSFLLAYQHLCLSFLFTSPDLLLFLYLLFSIWFSFSVLSFVLYFSLAISSPCGCFFSAVPFSRLIKFFTFEEDHIS